MPLPHHALGHVLAIEGDDAGAIRELRAALRLEPGKLESRRQLQVLERRSRLRSDQARTGVGSAARKGHATAAARTLEHATVARSSGQLDLAERLLREALHTTPDAPELAAELALTLLRRDPAHNARESNTLARAARQSDPKLPLPWVVLGMLLAQIGHVERALQMFRHALELDPECVEAQQELERPRP
jgi:Tfp pilus assembly protein PilF